MHHSLVSEYVDTAAAYEWKLDELRQMARNSVEACFCDSYTRKRLLADLAATST
jgi:adenosine deaminase